MAKAHNHRAVAGDEPPAPASTWSKLRLVDSVRSSQSSPDPSSDPPLRSSRVRHPVREGPSQRSVSGAASGPAAQGPLAPCPSPSFAPSAEPPRTQVPRSEAM